MKKAIAKKWTKALRSGKYEQGKHKLKRKVYDDENKTKYGYAYCCLGVLCELYKDETGKRVRKNNDEYLPTAVQKWANMASTNGEYKTKKKIVRSLVEKNDSDASFKEIAKIIETNAEQL